MVDTSSMFRRCLIAFHLSACLAAASPTVCAQPLRVLTAGAFKPVVVELTETFERESQQKLIVDNDTAGAILRRMRSGELWDLVIAPPATLAALAKDNRIDPASVMPLARVAIGVAVRQGSPKPEIGTVEQFKAAVLAARSPAFIDPKAGGSSGIYLDGLFQRLGISEALRGKAVLVPGGLVAERLTTGEADLAIHQISEILPVKGVELVGPLPASIQNYTDYSAAIVRGSDRVAASQSLVTLLRSERAAAIVALRGMAALR